jgi:hypothetical protein
MTPRLFLILVTLGIIAFNLITVKVRTRNASKLEIKLRILAKEKGTGVTLQDISQELKVPAYDAKILIRRFVTQGKMDVQRTEDNEFYVFRP